MKFQTPRISISISNKKRAVISLVILGFILSILLNIQLPLKKVSGTQLPQYYSYTVAEGDTLWSIAERHNFSGKDIREVVYYIKKANGIDANDYIHIGENLKIPLD